MRWSWKHAYTLVWFAVIAVACWTWWYAWQPLLDLLAWAKVSVWAPLRLKSIDLLAAFLIWFPPPWIITAWRVGITLSSLVTTGLLIRVWTSSGPRPAWTTLDGWLHALVAPIRTGYRHLTLWWNPPNLDRIVEVGANPDVSEAYQWADNYIPKRNSVVYGAVLDFAENSYKGVVEVSDSLDKKADDLMKIAGTVGAALAAAGRIAGIGTTLTSRPVLYAILCLVVTMMICARARKPVKKIVPFTIETAIKIAEESGLAYISDEDDPVDDGGDGPVPPLSPSPVLPTETQLKGIIAASYHWAITGTQYVIEWKARLVSAATFVFCVGLALLSYGFLRPSH